LKNKQKTVRQAKKTTGKTLFEQSKQNWDLSVDSQVYQCKMRFQLAGSQQMKRL
jgi:hypothetical protein